MFSLETPIQSVKKLSGDYFLLTLHSPRQASVAAPGHFFMLGLPGADESRDPLLNRPISVMGLTGPDDGPEGLLFLVKIVGRGTRLLAAAREGDTLRCNGPFGTTFPDPSPGAPLALVGGGVGIAPLVFCASRWKNRVPLHVFYGGKRAAELPVLASLEAMLPGAVTAATEDGSLGWPGMITVPLARHFAVTPQPLVFCCGPTAMMRAVGEAAADPGRVWVSLENRMACGIGICLGCALPVKEEAEAGAAAEDKPAFSMLRVCKEGPVFRADRIDWGRLPA